MQNAVFSKATKDHKFGSIFKNLSFYTIEGYPEKNTGILVSPNFVESVPVVDGIIFSNEIDFFSPSNISKKLKKLNEKTRASKQNYERFIRQKGRRPNYDIYACFQPFNEAYKALFPFISILKKRLKKNDVILNLWDRTGWTAAFLAGIFPENVVINVWEGDKDVLGYKGFHFWYTSEINKTKVQVIFHNFDKPFLFEDNSIGLVVGLDTFHRFDQSLLMKELFRITHDNATILFPHVHLTNNEPDPWFERGCRQIHGLDYEAFFQKLAKSTPRKGFVLPEPEMFRINELSKAKSVPLVSNPNSHHYNALIAIIPESWSNKETLGSFGFKELGYSDSHYLLINPLIDVDWGQSVVNLNFEKLAGQVGYLLERHPIYMEKLKRANNYCLSELELKILFLGGRMNSLGEICQRLSISGIDLSARIQTMEDRDILQVVPVTRHSLRLQQFVSTQEYILPFSDQTINALWKRAFLNYGDNCFIFSEFDDAELTYNDCNLLIENIKQKLSSCGLHQGDKIALVSQSHFEAVLSILAAVQLGIIVVPLDYELAQSIIETILIEINPAIVFLDYCSYSSQFQDDRKYKKVLFDEEGHNINKRDKTEIFSDWILEIGVSVHQNEVLPKFDDPAVILYTSGSTGLPKGVVLTHGHLVRSGRMISETFEWSSSDRFYSPGELDSMSGFRNHCIAPLEVGASIIISDARNKSNLFAICDKISKFQATILGTTPSLIGQMIRFSDRIHDKLKSVRMVISTGSNLYADVKHKFSEIFSIIILNYYGLTETTGICFAELPEDNYSNKNTVGKPVQCIAQIVNENGDVLQKGMTGRLRIFSENIMLGYLNNKSATSEIIQNNWLYTGDLARFQENGHLELIGRDRNIIKLASGHLVYISEVEKTLINFVAQVTICIVEIDNVEKMIAFVVPKSHVSDLEAYKLMLKDHVTASLGQRKRPHDIIIVAKIPVSSNGKVQKKLLISEYLRNKSL